MKALTVGSATIDTIAVVDSDRIERMSMLNADSSFLLLEEGRKTEAHDISTHCGGGAVNAAVAMARLGLDVSALVKLGQDARAETILARLIQEGVSTRWAVRDARLPTGASVMLASHDRNAAIFTFRGANTLLETTDLRDDAFAVDVVYISNLSNKSADCFQELVRRAKARGAIVAANPGVRQLSARGMAFQQTLGTIDVLAMNRAEADVLVPILVAKFGEGGPTLALGPGQEPPALAVRGLSAGGFEMSLVSFFNALLSMGPKVVLLTDGSNGAYAGSKEELLFTPALETEVASTSGAGDAFAATFVAYKVIGASTADALRAAAANAASGVSHVDTQTGLLSRSAIAERVAALSHDRIRRWSASGSAGS
jgi:ribokinase